MITDNHSRPPAEAPPGHASDSHSGAGPLVIIWAILTSVRFLFFHEINERLWVLSLLLDAGLGLFAVGIVAACLMRRRARAWWTASILALACVALWPLHGGRLAGTWSKFLRERGDYEREVERLLAAPPSNPRPQSEITGLQPVVDQGPPVRIAFSWGGILDNWIGIVYDPTGRILDAARRAPAPSADNPTAHDIDIAALFGGTLVHARHLTGPWYFCAFT